MDSELGKLYEATAEDMVFGIGTVQLPNLRPTPIIQIHYRDWPREKLEVVRESFRGGLALVSGKRANGKRDLYIATYEKITLQAKQEGHMDLLRGPAWDAHLAEVDDGAFATFTAERKRYGGFLLLVQTPEWECLTVVDENLNKTVAGTVLPTTLHIPDDQAWEG